MKDKASAPKTTTTAAPKPQAAVPIQTPELERPDIAAQLAAATRLGHHLNALNVHSTTNMAVPVQRVTETKPEIVEDEENLVGQAKFASSPAILSNKISVIQRAELPGPMPEEDEEEPVGQLKSAPGQTAAMPVKEPASPNNTGLPDHLKAGIEAISGLDMNDVQVHYNSAKPAELRALAYAQGTDIHVGPSQEQHLPHEAWHVVQQKQGRVRPTMQTKGSLNINDDEGLEKEADVMGGKAIQLGDNRPKATAQRKIQEMANSLHVKQLRAFQEIANQYPEQRHRTSPEQESKTDLRQSVTSFQSVLQRRDILNSAKYTDEFKLRHVRAGNVTEDVAAARLGNNPPPPSSTVINQGSVPKTVKSIEDSNKISQKFVMPAQGWNAYIAQDGSIRAKQVQSITVEKNHAAIIYHLDSCAEVGQEKVQQADGTWAHN